MTSNKQYKKENPLDFESWKNRINQIEENISQPELFEKFFYEAKQIINDKGIDCGHRYGQMVKIKYAQNHGMFSINYFIQGERDNLQMIIEEENYFRHIGLSRARGNLADFGYRPKILEKENLLEKLDSLNSGQFHPEKTYFLNKEGSKSILYDFRIRQKKKIFHVE